MEHIHRAAAALNELGAAVLISADGVGLVHVGRARTRQPEGASGTFWFFADARRVSGWQPAGRPVSLSFYSPGQRACISVEGVAVPVRDRDARAAAWDTRFTSWFPGGPADPRLALLEVRVTAAECVGWHGRLAG